MSYRIGPSVVGLEDAKERLGYYPASKYVQELEHDHGGGLRPVGYPRSVWHFAGLTVTQYQDLLQTLLGFSNGQYSGQVYIQTRNEWDTWANYRAFLRAPAPGDLDRWGGTYRHLDLEFVLVEVVV